MHIKGVSMVLMYSILIADMTRAPLPSQLHSSLVPLHPGVCVSRDTASSPKADHSDIKAKACCSLYAMRRMSWENDPVSGWSSPRTTRSHLRGAVSAFLCVCTVKAEWPGAWSEKAVTCLRANSFHRYLWAPDRGWVCHSGEKNKVYLSVGRMS